MKVVDLQNPSRGSSSCDYVCCSVYSDQIDDANTYPVRVNSSVRDPEFFNKAGTLINKVRASLIACSGSTKLSKDLWCDASLHHQPFPNNLVKNFPSQISGRRRITPPFLRKASAIARRPAPMAFPYFTPTKVASTPKAPAAATLSPVTKDA